MTCIRGTVTKIDNFDVPKTLTTTPDGHMGWTIADTSSAGTPTYAVVTAIDGGHMALTLDAQEEAENVCMYHNDILLYDAAKLQKVWFVAKVAGVAANSVLTWGMGAARADDEDTVAESVFFKMEGATSTTAVVVETDHATNEQVDVATGDTLADVYKKFEIDFAQGLADVRFYIDGARVAAGTTFNMSDITSGQNLQPMVQVSKASSTDAAAFHLAQFGIQYSYAYGA